MSTHRSPPDRDPARRRDRRGRGTAGAGSSSLAVVVVLLGAARRWRHLVVPPRRRPGRGRPRVGKRPGRADRRDDDARRGRHVDSGLRRHRAAAAETDAGDERRRCRPPLLSGTWTVDTSVGEFSFEDSTGTFVGFRVAGGALAASARRPPSGARPTVTGTITFDGTTLTAATIEADMTAITTNDSRRDDHVQDALETGEFPTATFTLTEPIDLGDAVNTGAPVSVEATGDLTIHGVTTPVTLPLEAQLVDGTIVVVGSLDIALSTYGVEAPSAPIVVSVSDDASIELQLFFSPPKGPEMPDTPDPLSRRGLLAMAAAAGATVLAACSSDGSGAQTSSASQLGPGHRRRATSTGTSPATSSEATTATTAASTTAGTDSTTAVTDAASCEPIPEETAGPFPGDGSNGPDVLAEADVVRSDIRTSIGSASGAADGVPLTIELTITDTATGCTPLADAAVYLWHCDREGSYSMYSDGAEDENYLRGVQVTDADGRLSFTSIFPACYSGRWPHAHFEVYASRRGRDRRRRADRHVAAGAPPGRVRRRVRDRRATSRACSNLAQLSLRATCVLRRRRRPRSSPR